MILSEQNYDESLRRLAAFSYHAIAKVDFTDDAYEPVQVYDIDWSNVKDKTYYISNWFKWLATPQHMHKADITAYKQFTDLDNIRRTMANRKQIARIRYRRNLDGIYRWRMMELVPVPAENGHVCATMLVRDLDDPSLFAQGERGGQAWAGLFDELTGLGNKYTYENTLKRLEETGSPCTIVYCDVRGMKRANDLFGQKEGDRVLRRFCSLLRKHFRMSDCFRIENDEFLVVLPNVGAQRVSAFYNDVHGITPPPASVGVSATDGDIPLEQVVAAAQRDMLVDKENIHANFPETVYP
ncbi:MAG: GGDEF domain-containing protein [Coriobacteriia bacterium]|nr:GGDEF domain-containing protein [Coriobacteriia bacterium]